MKTFICYGLTISALVISGYSHADSAYDKELRQGCSKLEQYAAQGKSLYDQQQYTKARQIFQQQAAWSAFCASQAQQDSGVTVTARDTEIANNNTGLSYARSGQPLWARAWFQLNPQSGISQFNLKSLPAPGIASDLSGEYVRYAGFGAWNTLTVKKQAQHYHIRFDGLYMGARSLIYGPNSGQFETAMPLGKKHTVYQQSGCNIDLQFDYNASQGNLVSIKQNDRDSDCGFGMNVSSTGTYQKVENLH